MPESLQTVVLNPQQRKAVEHVHGPMLVVAGAGTGKTTVLTERISHLIEQRHARPDEILAMTFTRNAAEEFRSRVAARIGPFAAQQLIASTFHSYCAQLLEAGGIGFQPLSNEDLWIYVRQRLGVLGLEHFVRPNDLGDFLRDLMTFFDRCSDENVDAAAYEAYVTRVATGQLPVPALGRTFAALPPEQRLARLQEIARVFRKIENMLAADKLGTYGQQITRALALARQNIDLLKECTVRARFILVDEFQDCNSALIQLLHLLAGREENVFVVGDPDQAIYRFRGASHAAFDQFLKLFPRSQGVVLKENQRSRGPVLACSYELIRENPGVKVPVDGKASYSREPLVSARDETDRMRGQMPPAVPVEVLGWTEPEQEAADIAARVRELLDGHDDGPRDDADSKPWFGVLYRSHAHRRQLVTELAQRHVRYIVTGVDVQDTGDVRDLLAILRSVGSAGDTGSLFRVAALPRFGVPGEELRRRLKEPGEMSFHAILSSLPEGAAVLKAVEEAREFARGHNITSVVNWCLEQFGIDRSSQAVIAFRNFVEVWKKKPQVRRRDLREFLDYMEYFSAAGGFIPLRTEEEQERLEHGDLRAVRLMTAHGAKGLEFRHVFVIRAMRGSFPISHRPPLLDFPAELSSFSVPSDGSEAHLQEERRLLYVAMTRARDTLALYARQVRGKAPTGFLRSLLTACKGQPFLRSGQARPFTIDVQAAAAPASPVGQWLSQPPRFNGTPTLSAHSVETYNECPLHYKLSRDWRIPGDTAAALQFGNAIHTVLKRYYDPQARAMTSGQLADAFHAEWAKVRLDDPQQHALYERRGATQLRELATRYPRGSSEVIATEQAFLFQLGPLEVRGRMDRIDALPGNRVNILDYKTGKPRRSEHADKSLQLSIYAMAAEQLGYKVEGLAFINLENGETMTTQRDPGTLEDAREQIQKAADGIARGEFEANPGFHCRWCAYKDLCPATEESLVTIGAAGPKGVN